MQKKPYRESTIETTIKSIKALAREVDLNDVEAVKACIARRNVCDNRKAVLCESMARYYSYVKIPFQKPIYRRTQRLPFIPLEREIDDLISGCNRRVATFLQVLKETAIRPGECWRLKWSDIDIERCCLTMDNPEKNSNSGQYKISNRLIAMLNTLPHESNWIFHKDKYPLRHFTRLFARQRNQLATKLQNPRLQQINFKTFRHFKATMEYHRTKDILYVMNFLRHIGNTLVYTHLVNWESDDYVCKVASTLKEAEALIEGGFEYVTEMESKKLFRKRK
jgi:integrase